MPTDDDDAAGHHGGGPLSAMIRWNWNYMLMIFGTSFRSLYFWIGLIVLAFVAGALAF